jgi:hypothetical protein
MTTADDMRTLITRAELGEQHRCSGCGCLLVAYGREPSDRWSCPACALPGKTVALKYDGETAD